MTRIVQVGTSILSRWVVSCGASGPTSILAHNARFSATLMGSPLIRLRPRKIVTRWKKQTIALRQLSELKQIKIKTPNLSCRTWNLDSGKVRRKRHRLAADYMYRVEGARRDPLRVEGVHVVTRYEGRAEDMYFQGGHYFVEPRSRLLPFGGQDGRLRYGCEECTSSCLGRRRVSYVSEPSAGPRHRWLGPPPPRRLRGPLLIYIMTQTALVFFFFS